METFKNAQGKSILLKMVEVIQENKEYLGQVDGEIGDGDHGINMNKGFTLFQKKYQEQDLSFTEGLRLLGNVLLNEIGGSMGPIYGTIFLSMWENGDSYEEIGLNEFSTMLENARQELFLLVDAREGDKTLIDCLSPAVDATLTASKEKQKFSEALERMCEAAEEGKENTRNLIAKYGRASRLGQRSKGVLDAGAVSCCFLLKAMANGIEKLLYSEKEENE